MRNFLLFLLLSFTLLSCMSDKEKIRRELNAGIKSNFVSDYTQAEIHFNNVLSIDEYNAEAYLNIGHVNYNRRNYDKSMEYANKAIEYNEKYGEAYKLRAEIYKKIYKDSDKACENYFLAEQYGVENLYNYTRHCK